MMTQSQPSDAGKEHDSPPEGRYPRAALHIRLACADDALDLLRWRNDPVTRAASRNSEVISQDEHRRWLQSALIDPEQRLLVLMRGDEAVATARWKRAQPTTCRSRYVSHGGGVRDAAVVAEISITVAPKCRGMGLAPPLIGLAEKALLSWGDFARARCVAVVHATNLASRRTFEGCGYTSALRSSPPEPRPVAEPGWLVLLHDIAARNDSSDGLL